MLKDTKHTVYFQNAQKMEMLADESVHLILTSPPYPMVEMWDDSMCSQNDAISEDTINSMPEKAFEMMHSVLDSVWKECYRILKPGCFMCINIGDATRNVNNEFRLFCNHSRIVKFCTETLGMSMLPSIIWSKPTNAPTKFLGSGVLPCGAYVTLEHEYILIFRKQGKREFNTDDEKQLRKESACFFEERNVWFSDIWKINGVKQNMKKTNTGRERTASFPIEIPFRLVNMFSCIGDTVVEPFYGLGTTSIASMLCGRNSVGFEIDKELKDTIQENINSYYIDDLNMITSKRYNEHLSFIRNRKDAGKDIRKYFNHYIKCSVVSGQETDIKLQYIKDIKLLDDKDNLSYSCTYNHIKNVNESPNENALF